MKILFCGCLLPRIFESRIKSLSVAGNQYQSNLISFLKSEENEVDVLSFIGFPLDVGRNEIMKESEKSNIDVILSENPLVSLFQYRSKLKKAIKKVDIVISYNCLYPWYGIGNIAFPKKSVLVLADYTPVNEEKGFFHKMRSALALHFIKQYSKVVLLSPKAKECVSKYQEIEIINGCLDLSKFSKIEIKNEEDIINIVYTGALSKVTGIDILLEAFSLLEGDKYRLIICGQGTDCQELLQRYCVKDKRIDFRGLVTTEEYINILNESDVLVNPRNMNLEQNKYNFPSKVLEYLATGHPVVSTRFSGYETYTSYFEFVDTSKEAIKEGILNALKMDRYLVFERNRNFSISFSWEKQIKKFI